MSTNVLRVAWYRFGATFRNRWGGYVSIVLLVGLLGGLAMGSVAAARRTQSSFPRFLASTNPSDLTTIYNGATSGYDPTLVDTIAHLPHVKHVENVATLNAIEVGSDGKPVDNATTNIGGSVDGLYFDQDRPSITEGRLPDPRRPDEAGATVETARTRAARGIGDLHRLLHQRPDERAQLRSGKRPALPARRRDARRDRGRSRLGGARRFRALRRQRHRPADPGAHAEGPPVLRQRRIRWAPTRPREPRRRRGRDGDRARPPAKHRLLHPRHLGQRGQSGTGHQARVHRFGVFGAIAALASLLIAGQVIGRQLRLGADDLEALRALGASPGMTTSDGLIGVACSVVLGSLLAGRRRGPLAARSDRPRAAGRPIDRHRVRLDRSRPRLSSCSS